MKYTRYLFDCGAYDVGGSLSSIFCAGMYLFFFLQFVEKIKCLEPIYGKDTLYVVASQLSSQTNSHLGQVTPFLVKSSHKYIINKDYSEGGGYLAPIVGQSFKFSYYL